MKKHLKRIFLGLSAVVPGIVIGLLFIGFMTWISETATRQIAAICVMVLAMAYYVGSVEEKKRY